MSLYAFPALDAWLWPAICIRVVDGDTLDVLVDRGFRDTSVKEIRPYGIDTPERGEPGYKEATEGLRSLVMNGGVGRSLIVRTIKPHEKYGRWLASIEVVDTGLDVVTEMINLGLGVPYFGGKK